MAGKQISTLSIALNASVAPFVSAFSGVRNVVSNFTSSVASAGGQVIRFTGLAGGIGAAFGAIRGAARGISLAAELEQTNVAFTTMLGSASAAEKLMGQLTGFAASTPFEFPEIASSAKSLLAFGVAADQIQPSLARIGDISAGVGQPIGDIAEIFGKAKVAGTLYAEDINQLVGRGIPVIQEFAKQLGVSESQVKKMASEGRISFDMLDRAFTDLTGSGGKFAGMMDAQSRTLAGLWSTFTDTIGMAAAGFVSTLVEAFRLRGALASLTGFAERAGDAVNGFVASVAPIVVGFVDRVWQQITRVGSVVTGYLAPAFAVARAFVTQTFAGIVAAVSTSGVTIRDALIGLGSVVGAIAAPFLAWRIATLATAAAQLTMSAATTAAGIAMNAARAIAGGLAMAQAGVTWAITAATAAQAALTSAWTVGRATTIAFVAAVRGMTAGQVAWRAVTLTGTAAQWLLNAALTANPVGIVVVAIGALAAWIAHATDKTSLFDGAVRMLRTATEYASVGFNNLGLVAKLAATAGAFEIVRFTNVLTYQLTTVAPAMLAWLASNWRNVFTTVADFTGAVFTNMGANVRAFFAAVSSWIAGRGFDFKWTALTAGFESAMGELPKIAERQAGAVESRLAAQLDGLQGQWRDALAGSRKPEAAPAANAEASGVPQPEPSPVAPVATDAGTSAVAAGAKTAADAVGDLNDKVKEAAASWRALTSGGAEAMQIRAQAEFAARIVRPQVPAATKATDESAFFEQPDPPAAPKPAPLPPRAREAMAANAKGPDKREAELLAVARQLLAQVQTIAREGGVQIVEAV